MEREGVLVVFRRGVWGINRRPESITTVLCVGFWRVKAAELCAAAQ